MTPIEFDAILFSARVAFFTVLLCFPLALLIASWTGRRGLRWRWLMDAVLLLPLGLSPAVIGWGLLSLAARDGMAASWLTQGVGPKLHLAPHALMLAAACLVLPLMIRTMRPGFEAVDHHLVMTARTLGATRWGAWWSITVAQAGPMLLSAVMLGFAAAWGETGAAVVLAAALQAAQGIQGTEPGVSSTVSSVPLTLLSAMQTERGQAMAMRLSLVSMSVALAAMLASEWARQRWRRHTLPSGARGVRK
ncbi:MAG: ABC transporter permease subunit [Rubrivivax sp.]|nr:MAG: ABC transporter permease subunit [Rubrivivax sp.]